MAIVGNVNIILHGLLFLELKKSASLTWLEITAPQLTDHNLLVGVPGNLQNINGKEIHWETSFQGGQPGVLNGGIPGDVPREVFQFSRSGAETGDIDGTGIQGKIFLPWPAQWKTIRRGDRPALDTRLPRKSAEKQVQSHIKNRCNTMIGVATVLSYNYPLSLPPIEGWSPSVNIEIYFQPKHREDIRNVNDDLTAASKQLFKSDNFDLIFDTGNSNASTPIGEVQYPDHSGLSVGDEISLNEIVRVVDPKAVIDKTVKDAIATIQAYILTLPPIIVAPDTSAVRESLASQYARHDEKRPSQGDSPIQPISVMMASPANCPMLFLGA